jgi:hypothetical protein
MGTFAQLNGFGCERPIDRPLEVGLLLNSRALVDRVISEDHHQRTLPAPSLGRSRFRPAGDGPEEGQQALAIQRAYRSGSGIRVNLCQLLLRPA